VGPLGAGGLDELERLVHQIASEGRVSPQVAGTWLSRLKDLGDTAATWIPSLLSVFTFWSHR
jgi:hypothetical protein